MIQISDNVFLYCDTCNVYVVRKHNKAVLIDFGSGDVLNQLESIGVGEISAILMTHHHRDQGQGLKTANKLGIPIFVPHTERDLFEAMDEHWQARQIKNNYNVRQDRFSLLHSVQVAGTLQDYGTYIFNETEFFVLPTPGHTTGSITIIAELDGQKTAFCGDLIAGPGKIWSLSATQWTYNGAEGIFYSVLSLFGLQECDTNRLLPSHGETMNDPASAIEKLIDNLKTLMEVRSSSGIQDVLDFREHPFEPITPHLLLNRTSFAHSYVLLSGSGKALLIDFGYDFNLGKLAAGVDTASRRPWLYSIKKLKQQYGVSKIDVVLPTHYHDDHVAGLNLLRQVEGTQVWAAENFADLLEHPNDYDEPCLWYEPIRVERKIPMNQPFTWEEYEFTLYEQPGHTLYATAIAFEADGKKVLAIGDQQGNDPYLWNYVYQNRFQYEDYRRSAELYRRILPDIIISGHWDPLPVTPVYLNKLSELGEALERTHMELLPTEQIDMTAGGFIALMHPYHTIHHGGGKIPLSAEILNPFHHDADVVLTVIVPADWVVDPIPELIQLPKGSKTKINFFVEIPPDTRTVKERIAIDVTVGNIRFGQQAEALVTVK